MYRSIYGVPADLLVLGDCQAETLLAIESVIVIHHPQKKRKLNHNHAHVARTKTDFDSWAWLL